MALTTEFVADLGDLSPAWDRMVDAAAVPTPFLRTWWLTATATPRRGYLLVRDGDELVGGFAFERHRRGGVEFLREAASGTLCPDHLDVLAAPGRIQEVGAQVRAWLQRPGARYLALSGLLDNSQFEGLPGGRTDLLDVAPYVELTGDGGYLASVSGALRRKLRKAREGLDGAGVVFEAAATDELDDALDQLAALLRPRGDRGPLLAELPRLRRALYAGYAAGEARVDLLRTPERVIGAVVSFTVGDAIRLYQLARDVHSPLRDLGWIQLYMVIEQAERDRLREVDFLRGSEGYKSRFTDDRRDVVRIRAGLGRTGRAWLLLVLLSSSLRRRLARLRRWISRRSFRAARSSRA